MSEKTARQKDETARDLDPDVRQRLAARPSHSIWVNASAGTGKTKVLTDRLLRLLLPKENGEPGTPPHKILCLTFTKTGASEMALRLNKILGGWAIAPESRLQADLKKLLGRVANPEELRAARRLFAQVVDTPGGLKIMTLHSFCQAVLSRFALEAGIQPHMEVLEEAEAARLLQQAHALVVRHAGENPLLQEALAHIAGVIDETRFMDIVRAAASERRQLEKTIAAHGGIDGLYEVICKTLDIAPGTRPQDLIRDACRDEAFDNPALRQACKALADYGSKTFQDKAAQLQTWLDQDAAARMAAFESYAGFYLTQKEEKLKNLVSKEVTLNAPGAGTILDREADRILALKENIRRAACALYTRDILRLSHAIIEQYQALKNCHGGLDYDDLIFRTLDLLEGRNFTPERGTMAAWVLYKLDQGIDHILIDEAQDTNPEQWEILKILSAEFHAGQNARDISRSLFTVGDHKQSIYSFQRASPQEFTANHEYFERRFMEAGQPWDNIVLNISFRSTKSVLEAVDAVFAGDQSRQGLSDSKILHHSHRIGQAGRVELWPLAETSKSERRDPWTPPVQIHEKLNGGALAAERIATAIHGWLHNGEILPSRGRAVQPGDILVLVRTRTVFVDQLSRALKNKNVPVSGTDRMVLGNHIAVQDLLAAAEFALAPHDDLTLACLLKSPLIGMEEDILRAVAHGRSGSLWQAVQASAHREITDYLRLMLAGSGGENPFTFMSQLLQRPCPADARSGLRAFQLRLGKDVQDPFDEFLSAALVFRKTGAPTLQSFVQQQRTAQTEIKREHEDHAGQVRIMTVHGAKGLQAPVVILPDTIRTSLRPATHAGSRLLWPDKSNLPVPLWSPLKAMDPAPYSTASRQIESRLDEEYRRLLYVAMTRAEDRLYVMGYAGTRPPSPDSWYYRVKAGLESLPETERQGEDIMRLENPQTREPDRADMTAPAITTAAALPAWLFEKAPEESAKRATLTPSNTGEDTISSPLQGNNTYRFQRGNLTHKLLEILPALEPARRETATRAFIGRYGAALPEEIRSSIVAETLAVLDHPEFAAVFGPGSLAEVPVAGVIDGTLIEARIDRLLVTDALIRIIDYKTNRPPPTRPQDIPALYIRQLELYAGLLQRLYPGRRIEAALLWTDGPLLMPVPLEIGA